jgi:hypothetical protein
MNCFNKNGCLIIFLLCGFSAVAQRQITGDKFRDRLYYGGNIGASFGAYSYFQLSPRIGYMVNSNFSVGTGATYIYINNKSFGANANVYGGNVFARHNIFHNFFVQTEFEELNTQYSFLDIASNEVKVQRGWVPGLFIGGGVFRRIGNRMGFSLAGYYNLLYDSQRSPYNSAFTVRAGFNF